MQNIVLICKDAKEISTLFEIEIKKTKEFYLISILSIEKRETKTGEKKKGKKRLNLLNYCMAVSCFHDFSICSRIRLKT